MQEKDKKAALLPVCVAAPFPFSPRRNPAELAGRLFGKLAGDSAFAGALTIHSASTSQMNVENIAGTWAARNGIPGAFTDAERCYVVGG
ncbi:MAG: hypothetical protein C5B51_24125 [Terriglobia bacterium]|nr:MAG: hypothetical protein C5B51_24125 [Terriglobia bacterium]